jgi:putative hydrolase
MADGPDDEPNPGDVPNIFSAFPMFGEIAKAMQGQGPLNWDAARQFAMLGATQGQPESNVDPTVRIAFGELARIASMHVSDLTGADMEFPEPRIVTRGQWAHETLEAYRPLFTDLASSLGQQPADSLDPAEAADPMLQMMAGLNKMVGPAMLGMSVGSMVGTLAQRVFGVHDLPIPREQHDVVLVAGNIDAFAAQWSIPVDQMRLWVIAHELIGYRLFAIDHLRNDLAALVRAHVGGFRPDPTALADKMGDIDITGGSGLESIQQLFGDPEVLLGAIQSPEQKALQPRLDAAVAVVVGYVDWMVDAMAARLIGGEALTVAEAVRRTRLDSTPDDLFVDRLLGIRIGNDQVVRGKQFVQGVVDRVGESELNRLLTIAGSMPTPNEVDAPGLWIARVGDT